MAPKRIHTRRNLDPQAIIPVSDPEKLVHKRKERPISPFFCLDKNLSLPKDGVKRIEDLDFDLKFEKTLFITRSESSLNEIIFDKKRFQDLIPIAPIRPAVIPTHNNEPLQVFSVAMAARFSPLVLPSQLHDLPRDYN
jgi:hypothetical protein